MQSSFNVIKKSSVVSEGCKKIEIECKVEKTKNPIEEINSKNNIDSYENLAKNILENARRKADKIVADSYREVQSLEENAVKKGYDEGYDRGYKEGQDKGYKDSYEKYLKKGEEEYKKTVDNCNNILLQAQNEYDKYLKDKEKEVRELVESIVYQVLKREVKDCDSLNDVIYDVLEKNKKAKSIVVRCNENYLEEVKGNIEEWRIKLPFKGEIFVIEDNLASDGKVVIETEMGKVIVDINIALEKLKNMLLGI